jgi:CheY-like chemotaxis protein
MQMPHCDGPTALKAIRSNPGFTGLRIFGVSGAQPAEFNLPSGAAGLDGWFAKPLNPSHLCSALLAGLNRN